MRRPPARPLGTATPLPVRPPAARPRCAPHLAAVSALTAALALGAGLPAPTRGQASSPDAAVFQLVTVMPTDSALRPTYYGTAFFTDPDGTALTNSHVVARARGEPGRYELAAVVGREFYSVTVVCASPVALSPPRGEVPLARDVAQVRLAPSRFRITHMTMPGGLEITAHVRALPVFPTLPLGGDPAPGGTVRIIGYGHVEERLDTSWTRRWIATGTVDEIGDAPDGTRVFRVRSTDRPRLGNSGSPVLDDHGAVIGMWTWNEAESLAFGVAISGTALRPACR